MNFRVQWEEEARDELGNAWLEADSANRREMTEAAHYIDVELARDPFSESESREAERRVMFVGPLGILFRVDESNRSVRVLRVWQIRRKKK